MAKVIQITQPPAGFTEDQIAEWRRLFDSLDNADRLTNDWKRAEHFLWCVAWKKFKECPTLDLARQLVRLGRVIGLSGDDDAHLMEALQFVMEH